MLFFFYNLLILYSDVSKNRGTPKWMVNIMENPIKMDDLGDFPIFLETPICVRVSVSFNDTPPRSMTWGPLPLGSPKIGIQQVGFGPCDTQISVGTIFGPRTDRYLIELWEPYKWPKINGQLVL